MSGLIFAVVVIGALGIIIGVLLGAASEVFAVQTDEKEVAIRAELPGNNCGGCGYPGCDGLAAAIAKGEAPVNQCPVGGAAVAEKIAAIMGSEVEETEKMVAFVKCGGTCDKARVKYNYYGIHDCGDATAIPGAGEKACAYGCLGFGTCTKACKFDAIHVVDGVALVDKEKCVACGKCIQACPNHLIELVPYKDKHFIRCSSQDKGKAVMDVCDVGCIACTKCVKDCPFGAISMNGNLPVIDFSVCKNCGKCSRSCPRSVIT